MQILVLLLFVLRAQARGQVEEACSSAGAEVEAVSASFFLQSRKLDGRTVLSEASDNNMNGTTDLTEANDNETQMPFPPPELLGKATNLIWANDTTPLPPPASLPLPAALLHGLVFIKTYKVGGSTWGGVMRRIGYRRGLAHARDDGWLKSEDPAQPEPPAVFAEHAARRDISNHLARKMPKAFFVTLIRDPIARCLSAFYYFVVSIDGEEPTEAAKLHHIKHRCSSRSEVAGTEAAPWAAPSAVMNSFDFVALTERFDESLLLLAKKLGIGQRDVMYLSAKESGGKFAGHDLVPHPPFSSEPQSVQEAAKRLLGEGADAEMHAAANRTLDKEIADYGPSFGKDLAEFQRRLSIVAAKCEPRQSCLWRDNGCGQACIDSIAEDLHWD